MQRPEDLQLVPLFWLPHTFVAPSQPGTETPHLGARVGNNTTHIHRMHEWLTAFAVFLIVFLCSPEPFSSRDFAPSLHRSSAVCRYQLPLSPSGPCVADQILR